MPSGRRPKLLGVYAHPDDESFCTGATFARYAADGCEIMVVSATSGQAGQIRSGKLATRGSLANVRTSELRQACQQLGVAHVECWDYMDGTLQDLPAGELEGRIATLVQAFHPDAVFTFADDGAYGHPDHIAISQETTAACARLWEASTAPWLYHAVFPRRRLLLQDRLVHWLIMEGPDFRGDPEFVHALLLLAEEASSLHCIEDHYEVKWFPSDFSIIEQGEPSTALFLLLAGHADVVRDGPDGSRTFVVRLEPGQFFGEQGIARRAPRNAHVIAGDAGATCLVLSPSRPTLFDGRGEAARLASPGAPSDDVEIGGATARIPAGDFLRAKLNAIAAYRTQFPFNPDMLPESIFGDLFGAEYFLQVLPPRPLDDALHLPTR